MLIYHGNIPEVHKQIKDYGKHVQDAIKSVLKDERYSRLESITRKLLVSEAFEILSQKELSTSNGFLNANIQDSNFFCHSDSDDVAKISVQQDGRVVSDSSGIIKTYPQIAITPVGIENRKQLAPKYSDIAPLDSYLHEFFHFAVYCLQQIPMGVSNAILLADLRKKDFQATSFEDPNQFIQTFHNQGQALAFSTMYGLLTHEEINASALHAEVYKRAGMNDAWEIMMRPFYSETNLAKFCDSLKRDLNSGNIDIICDWDRKLVSSIEYRNNFYKTIRNAVKIERLPISNKQK